MRLPDSTDITDPDERFLYQCDLRELHASNWLSRVDYRNRLRLVVSLTRQMASGHQVLDVGCAQGNIATLLAEEGFQVTALDLRLTFLRYARRKRTHGDLNYIVANGDQLPFAGASYDVIILTELLEHVAWPEEFLQAARRCLRPGGILVVSTPNGEHRYNNLPTFREIASNRQPFEQLQFGPDGSDHLFLYTLDELTDLVGRVGLEPLVARPIGYDWVIQPANRVRSWRFWSSRPGRVLSCWIARSLLLAERMTQGYSPLHRRFGRGLFVVARKGQAS